MGGASGEKDGRTLRTQSGLTSEEVQVWGTGQEFVDPLFIPWKTDCPLEGACVIHIQDFEYFQGTLQWIRDGGRAVSASLTHNGTKLRSGVGDRIYYWELGLPFHNEQERSRALNTCGRTPMLRHSWSEGPTRVHYAPFHPKIGVLDLATPVLW